MYKNVPSWNKLVSFLYDLNYSLIDLKGIGNHITRIPAEADMIFIPNFNNKIGKKLWKNHSQTTNDILWYYKTLCNKLKKFLKNHKTLKDRFQRHVNELEYKIKN